MFVRPADVGSLCVTGSLSPADLLRMPALNPRLVYAGLVQNSYCVLVYVGVSRPPARGPVPGPGVNYTGSREVLLEFVILVF